LGIAIACATATSATTIVQQTGPRDATFLFEKQALATAFQQTPSSSTRDATVFFWKGRPFPFALHPSN
jgi:hypothetical protein